MKRLTIAGQLTTVICALLVPLLISVLWSASRTRLEQRQDVHVLADAAARSSAAHLDHYFAAIDGTAAAIVHHPSVIGMQPGCCQTLFTDLLAGQPLLSTIVLTLADGTPRAAAAQPSALAGQVSRAWVTQVASTGKPVVSDWYKGQISGKPVVTFGYPVRDDRQTIVGVLGFGVDLSGLHAVFSQVPLPRGSVITLMDRSGLVLARSVDAERFIGTTVTPPTLVAENGPVPIATDPDGMNRITAVGVVDRGPWLLSVAIPSGMVEQTLLPLWRRNVAIIGIAALALLAIGVLTASQATLHLNRLRSAAEQIANGDLSPPSRISSPNREFAELQDAFIQMALNLRAAREALDRQVDQERKMNETLHSLQRQVVRQERLAAVGVLVSGVAHELNNPLQAILGTAELLERQVGLSSDALDEVSFIKTQSGRAREIIRNLSRFSSQHTGPPSLVDLRDVVAEVVQLRRRDLDSSGIILDLDMTSERKVHANFTELEQVTLNFVINAQQSIEASRDARGRILVRVSDAGRKVRLEVLDNGAGVDSGDEPKLFQPFFTTKPVGKGTGLGLSVSYGIIDSYGGTIGYARNAWGGATFFFELPAVESADGRA